MRASLFNIVLPRVTHTHTHTQLAQPPPQQTYALTVQFQSGFKLGQTVDSNLCFAVRTCVPLYLPLATLPSHVCNPALMVLS